MLSTTQSDKIRSAFQSGKLKTRSISPQGETVWKRVLLASRSEVGSEDILEVTTTKGASVLTGGHRVFTTPTSKVEAEQLHPRETVAGEDGVQVVFIQHLPGRQYMYDLTVEGWHNFILHRSGMLVSNSPDRNYHWRPPTHEETIRQFSRVFGFIWEDEELKEYLERSMDMISLAPPAQNFSSLDSMCQQFSPWKTLLLTGAMYYALQALRINWVADEFSVAPETEVRVYLPDGQEFDIPIEELYNICYEEGWCLVPNLTPEARKSIREAFRSGCLQVQSVLESGKVVRASVTDVLRHVSDSKPCLKITLSGGQEVGVTADHSLFSMSSGLPVPTPSGDFGVGDLVAVVQEGVLDSGFVDTTQPVESYPFTYDLSVPGPENFVLSNGVVAHNSYSIGGVSLDLDKSSKYESAASSMSEQFDKMLEKAKQTVNIIRGLQQPRFGVGIRSAFGPYSGKGVLSPRKFVGL